MCIGRGTAWASVLADLAVLVAALAHGDGLGGGHDPVAEHPAGEAVGGGLADGEPGEDRRPLGAHQPGGLGGVVGAGGHDAGVEVGERRGHRPSLPDPAAPVTRRGPLFTGCSRPCAVIQTGPRPRTRGVTALIDTPDAAPDGQVARRRAPWWWGALAGLLAVGAALAVGELVTGVLEGTSSAVVSVGEVVVENAPNWLKEFAIETFGENDKDALIAGTTITLVLVSIVLGVASVRRLWIGIAGTVAFGVIGVWAALTRPGASPVDAWPSILGTLAGVAVLWFLLHRTSPAPAAVPSSPVGTVVGSEPEPVPAPRSRAEPEVPATMRPTGPAAPAPAGFDRRAFLVSAGLVAGGAVVVGAVGKGLQGRYSVAGARSRRGPPAALVARRRPPRRGRARHRRHHPVHHPQRRLLPGRHRPRSRPASRPSEWTPEHRRHGRQPHRAHLRGAPRPRDRRARHHPGLRLQRGRRPLRRHRPVAGRAARLPARRGRRAGRRRPARQPLGRRLDRRLAGADRDGRP